MRVLPYCDNRLFIDRYSFRLPSDDLMQSVGNGFADDAEVSIAQVEEELFQRPSQFYPRMSPSTAAVEPLLICHVVDDISRMFQWKLELKAFHGEDLAQSAWCRFLAGRIVRGVGGEADVVDEIALRHDGESVVEHHACPEYGLIVGDS